MTGNFAPGPKTEIQNLGGRGFVETGVDIPWGVYVVAAEPPDGDGKLTCFNLTNNMIYKFHPYTLVTAADVEYRVTGPRTS